MAVIKLTFFYHETPRVNKPFLRTLLHSLTRYGRLFFFFSSLFVGAYEKFVYDFLPSKFCSKFGSCGCYIFISPLIAMLIDTMVGDLSGASPKTETFSNIGEIPGDMPGKS